MSVQAQTGAGTLIQHVTGPDTGSRLVAGDLFLEPMRQAFYERVISHLASQVKLVVESMSYEHWAWGAGNLVLNKFYAAPTAVHLAGISG